MTQFPRSLTTCVFLTLLGGCVTDEAEPNQDSLRKGEPVQIDDGLWCDTELEPPTEAQACDDGRRLAFMQLGSSCEGPVGQQGSWNGNGLFQTPHPYLDRFCTFSWQENFVGAPPELGLLDVVAERHDAQCDSVSVDGSTWGDAVAGELSTVFRDHVDHVTHPDNKTGMFPHAVDVILVDTKVQGMLNSHSQHGDSLGAIVEDITCNGLQGCARATKYSLAMPRYYDADGYSTDLQPNGGSFGNLGDLARGLGGAYQQMLASTAERTVVNFSGGWEPSSGDPGITASNQLAILAAGLGAPNVRAAARAVHASLVALRCAGALPIVAAGNRVPGTCEYGPKFPAAWEQLPALTRDECVGLGFKVGKNPERPNHSSTSAYRPLVYSVGAIGYEGHRLGNVRPEGMPRLAAPGQNGVAQVGNQYSLAYSGSSVSTAVVAATAGLAWSYFPGLSASDLMDAIYASGHDVTDVLTGQTMLSDYSWNTDPDNVHQIGVCSALDYLCTLNNIGCTLSCDPGQPDTSALQQLTADLLAGALQPPPTSFVIPEWDKVPCEDACTGTPTTVAFSQVAPPPPPAGSYPLATYIPDPSDPSCVSCRIKYLDPQSTDATLVLSLDSAYIDPSITLEYIWLVSDFADGSSATSYLGTGVDFADLQSTTMTVSVAPHASLIPTSAIVRMQFGQWGRSYTRETAIPVIVGD